MEPVSTTEEDKEDNGNVSKDLMNPEVVVVVHKESFLGNGNHDVARKGRDETCQHEPAVTLQIGI
jgi:hypothetical protein